MFRLDEMPQLVGDVTWKMLSDPQMNQLRLQSLLNQHHKIKIISDTKEVQVFSYSTPLESYIVGYDKKLMQIIYYVAYSRNNKWLVQTQLWRDRSSNLSKNLPYQTIFDYSLKKFNMIITDQEQTKDGMNFWIRLLKIASSKGYDIGMFNIEDSSVQSKFDKSKTTIDKWISQHKEEIWGNSPRYQNAVAYIANKDFIK